MSMSTLTPKWGDTLEALNYEHERYHSSGNLQGPHHHYGTSSAAALPPPPSPSACPTSTHTHTASCVLHPHAGEARNTLNTGIHHPEPTSAQIKSMEMTDKTILDK